MLGPFLCGLLSQAPLLPKLRGIFAEFLNNASLAGLRIFSSSTCVGLRYGLCIHNSSFSRRHGLTHFATYISLRITHRDLSTGFPVKMPSSLAPDPFPACAILPCHYSSDMHRYRNLNLLSIGYVSRPLLRPRLTQGRSALPWKPWIFSLVDSHHNLATHSGILSSERSIAPYRYDFAALRMLPYRLYKYNPWISVSCLSPVNFRRRTSRPVSYYALFE